MSNTHTLTIDTKAIGCERCGCLHDLASWRSLPLVGGGLGGTTVNGQEKVTEIDQRRRCTCGSVMTLHVPLWMPAHPAVEVVG